MFDLATDPHVSESMDVAVPAAADRPDAVFIVERGRNRSVALFVDPVRPDGTVSYTNLLEEAVQLCFLTQSPYAENPVPIACGVSEPALRQDVEPGSYPFRIETHRGELLVGGLELEIDTDGASSTAFRVARTESGKPTAEVVAVIESGGMPSVVEFQTRPTQLVVSIEVKGAVPPYLLLGPNMPSGRITLPVSPVRQTFIAEVTEPTSDSEAGLDEMQPESVLQSGGNRQAEIIVDP